MSGDGSDGEDRQMERRHVFAVNGAAEFLDVVRQLLEDESYNVTTTNYVPRTFEQIEALHPDLIIIDLAAGGSAGWNLLERLQAEAATRGIPVLIVSTDPKLLTRARDEVERFGRSRFLAKPLDLDALLEAVRELIGPA